MLFSAAFYYAYESWKHLNFPRLMTVQKEGLKSLMCLSGHDSRKVGCRQRNANHKSFNRTIKNRSFKKIKTCFVVFRENGKANFYESNKYFCRIVEGIKTQFTDCSVHFFGFVFSSQNV
jgi:hypothetical protein